MKIAVHAVGRMKPGPEKALADRYLDRFARTGKRIGLEFAGIAEAPESRARTAAERQREEAARILGALPPEAALFLLDERGHSLTSLQFADALAVLRDAGGRQLNLAIGGPDGHDPALLPRAARVISLGAMTWPHQLARIMLAEQLYRAATILAGHPYHRA